VHNQYTTQSLGRVLRTEGTVLRSKFVFDIESQDSASNRIEILKSRDSRMHYAEYYNYESLPRGTHWKKHTGPLKLSDSYRALNIIRANEDGTYEYIKNRATGKTRKLTKQETVWLLLNV
jgi:hypothetical protein